MLPALQDGALFASRYRVLRCIATGAMGAVYEVVHVETDRRRALKVMLPHIAEDDDLRERFKREARIAANVDSEHIVEVFDAGVDEPTGMPFLVMELLRGEELGKRLKRLGRFPASEVVTYLHQAAMALDRTHEASIVHRDLKPANLFLTHRDDGSPRIKVLDFGVAKLLAEGTGKLAGTASVGTPLYMPPEQLAGDAISPAVDVYALGMIAYTLLTGKEYWVEEVNRNAGLVAFALLAVKGPPEPASVRAARRGVELPPAFDAWFARVTAPDPAARFCSASAAVDALATALGTEPLSSSGPRVTAAAPLGVAPADSGVGSGVSVSGTRAATMQPRRQAAMAAAIGAVGALLGAGWIYVATSSTPAASGAASAWSQQVAPETTAAPLRAAAPEITPVATGAPSSVKIEASAPAATSSSAAASTLPAASTSGARAAPTSTAAAPPTRPPSPPSTPRSTRPQRSLPTPVYSPD